MYILIPTKQGISSDYYPCVSQDYHKRDRTVVVSRNDSFNFSVLHCRCLWEYCRCPANDSRRNRFGCCKRFCKSICCCAILASTIRRLRYAQQVGTTQQRTRNIYHKVKAMNSYVSLPPVGLFVSVELFVFSNMKRVIGENNVSREKLILFSSVINNSHEHDHSVQVSLRLLSACCGSSSLFR